MRIVPGEMEMFGYRARRLIPPWESRRLHAWGVARVCGAVVLTIGSLLIVGLGGDTGSTYAWATTFSLLALLNLGAGVWEMGVSRSLPVGDQRASATKWPRVTSSASQGPCPRVEQGAETRAMEALVVYGSKRGGTEGLARMLDAALSEQGVKVALRPAREHRNDLARFDLVVVGGALYMGRWHRSARRFVLRESQTLRDKPVWFFSSGPIGESGESAPDLAPVHQVRLLMDMVGARGHATFGGRLAPTAHGFAARAMAKKAAGDWRDEDAVRQWSKEIMSTLHP
ncbi:MAG: flavodoxin domain-containing protein [Nocardioides sp.]